MFAPRIRFLHQHLEPTFLHFAAASHKDKSEVTFFFLDVFVPGTARERHLPHFPNTQHKTGLMESNVDHICGALFCFGLNSLIINH